MSLQVIRSGQDARVRELLPFVHRFVNRYASVRGHKVASAFRDDVFAAALVGCWVAVRRESDVDPRAFWSFAASCIRCQIGQWWKDIGVVKNGGKSARSKLETEARSVAALRSILVQTGGASRLSGRIDAVDAADLFSALLACLDREESAVLYLMMEREWSIERAAKSLRVGDVDACAARLREFVLALLGERRSDDLDSRLVGRRSSRGFAAMVMREVVCEGRAVA